MEFGAEQIALRQGQAAFTARDCPTNRTFLPRTLRKAFRQIMGSAASSQHRPKASLPSSNRVEDDNMNDVDIRPAKRQKVERSPRRVKPGQKATRSSSTSEGHMTRSSLGSKLTWGYNEDVLVFPRSKPPGDSIRVDVLQIVDDRPWKHNQRQVQLPLTDPVEIRCTLTIWTAVVQNRQGRVRMKEVELMVQVSSFGIIQRTFNETGQPSIQVILEDGPFVIPVKQLFVNKPSPNGAAPSYGLDDHYNLRIWLDPVGASANPSDWPPFDTGSKIEASSTEVFNQRIFCSKSLFETISDKQSQKVNLKLKVGDCQDRKWLQHSLGFDVRWAFPVRLQTGRLPAVPILGEFEDKDVTLVYSRCIRIFDGTESKTQYSIKGRGFVCAICTNQQPSWDFLRFHITTEHDQFSVMFNRSEEDQSVYYVELSNMDGATRQSKIEDGTSRELQLGLPQTAFNLEKYVSGDDTWVGSRRGPRDRPGNKRVSSSVSSVQESLRSTPITSVDLDFDNSLPKPRTRRRLVVPNIKQRMFHSTYKYELHPGDELSDNDDDLKYNWLAARHKDVIHDFTDLTDEEKDYIVQWDTFIMRKSITSNRFFPPALIQFMMENKAWFGERRSRGMEFGKHAMTLVLREAIDEECLKQCCAILGEATQEYKESMKSKGLQATEPSAEPMWPPPGRGKMDCICGKAVFPAGSLICRGPDCKRKYYHETCLLVNEAPKDFRCPDCRPPDAPVAPTVSTDTLVEPPAEITYDLPAEVSASPQRDAPPEIPPSPLRDVLSTRFLPVRKTPPITNTDSITRKVTPTVARKSGALPFTTRPPNSPQVANLLLGPKPARKSGAGFIPRPLSTDATGPRLSPPMGRPRTISSIPRSTPNEIATAGWSPAWKLQQSRSLKPQGQLTYRTYEQKVSEFGAEQN